MNWGKSSTNQGSNKSCKHIGMSRSRDKPANLVFLKLSKVFSESGKLFPLVNSVSSIISVWQFSPVGKTTDLKEIFALFAHSAAILTVMLSVIVWWQARKWLPREADIIPCQRQRRASLLMWWSLRTTNWTAHEHTGLGLSLSAYAGKYDSQSQNTKSSLTCPRQKHKSDPRFIVLSFPTIASMWLTGLLFTNGR